MNSFIENLNQSGGDFLNFAWPILWQSSLLIAALFTIDFVIRNKIQASIRYALWLVVLVKLCLPPTLALPTSPAWWLHESPSLATALPHYTVTYDTGRLPEISQNPPPVFVPPRPVLTSAAWLLLASGGVSVLLLAWLSGRWWYVARRARRSTHSERLTARLNETRLLAGVKSVMPVKLTGNSMSPAVCGLFRPVILIPQSLAEGFSDEQLRAVLLHELIHLRRRDVWLNFLQTLLQIIYWWHPLLWLANARIRRVREEAVDDAVMLALRNEAGTYAPTLLEVAKLALNRPLASLGLVGILESRSALRQRIERLVQFNPPRKAGLTFVSLCGVFVFSAVALPMGEAPSPAEQSDSTNVPAVEQQSLTLKLDPDIFIRNVKAQAAKSLLSATNDYTVILLDLLRGEGVDCVPPNGIAFNTQTGEITTQNTPARLEIFRRVIEQLNRANGICELPLGNNPLRMNVLIEARIYQTPSADFDKIVTGLPFYHGSLYGGDWWSASPEKFGELVENLESSGLRLIQRPRIQTGSGITTKFFVGNESNSVDFDCEPIVADGAVDLALRGTVVGGPAGAAVTNYFHTKASAEDHGGIVVRVKNYGSHTGNNLVAVIGVQMVTNTVHSQERLQVTIPDKAASANGLVRDAKVLFEMGKFDEAEERLKSALTLEPENQAAQYYMNLVQACKANRRTGMIQNSAARRNILDKLNRIQLDQFGPNIRWPLKEVVRELNQMATGLASGKSGIHFFTAENFDGHQPMIDSNTRLPAKDSGTKGMDINSIIVTIDPPLRSVTMAEVLDAIVLSADKPIQYSVSDEGIVFSPKMEAPRLFSRTFQMDAHGFPDALRNITGLQTNSVSTMAQSLFSKCGVDLKPPESVFYNDRLGLLFVRATMQDLDTIERALQALNQTAPQIHIKARFIEVPASAAADVYLGSFNAAGGSPAGDDLPPPTHDTLNQPKFMVGVSEPASFPGIMTESQFQAALRALESLPDVEELAEPEVTTLNGRQTQMRATQIITVITNFGYQEISNVSAIFPQTNAVEIGLVMDTVATVLPDGYTIDLKTTASLTEFLGYDQPTNSIVKYNAAGQKVNLPTILPSFGVRKATARIKLWDGQTVVLGGIKPRFYDGGKEVAAEPGYFRKTKAARGQPNEGDKDLLVFITITLVDPAGNRIHSDDEMPFAKGAIPPQDGL
ncbi:MAG: M56 family metallopeptidase [Limisphaerales bacterium]